jgi:hypothetical protein
MMRRLALLGALVLTLSATASLVLGGTAAAKKKGGGKAAIASGSVGAIPNGPTIWSGTSVWPATSPVPFRGIATIGKKFKGKRVGVVEVTISLSGTPAAGTSCGAICDLTAKLSAPNGATQFLFFGGGGNFGGGTFSLTGNTVTNLTYSDLTATRTCGGPNGSAPPPPCTDPDATLVAPYTGKAEPSGNLNVLNGSPIKGTWTLTAYDNCGNATACSFFGPDQGTSRVTSWSVRVTPATKPK